MHVLHDGRGYLHPPQHPKLHSRFASLGGHTMWGYALGTAIERTQCNVRLQPQLSPMMSAVQHAEDADHTETKGATKNLSQHRLQALTHHQAAHYFICLGCAFRSGLDPTELKPLHLLHPYQSHGLPADTQHLWKPNTIHSGPSGYSVTLIGDRKVWQLALLIG
jgi:hypothetical protein